MVQLAQPIRGSFDFPPRPKPKPKKGKTPSPPPPQGPITQASVPTAGLYGVAPLVLVPFWNPQSGQYLINYFDTSNFDSEENASYNFRIEEADDRSITIHKAIITYRDLGKAQFVFGYNWYSRDLDKYFSVSKTVKIGTSTAPGTQRKVPVDLVITGESVQAFITRLANSGPVSIIRVRIAGHGGESELV